MSVNKSTKELKLVHTKFLPDGTKLEKIESYLPKAKTRFEAFLNFICRDTSCAY